MSKDKELLISRAQKHQRKGEISRAIDLYARALVMDQKDIRIILQLAELYAKINDQTNAIKFFLSGASYLMKDGFYSRAVVALKRVLEFSPDNVEVLKSLHELHGKLGLLVEAGEYALKLKSLNVEIEQPVPAKRAGKKKRRSRKQLKICRVLKKHRASLGYPESDRLKALIVIEEAMKSLENGDEAASDFICTVAQKLKLPHSIPTGSSDAVDPDTAFDLAIAYKEMGIYEDTLAMLEIAKKAGGFRRMEDCLIIMGEIQEDHQKYTEAIACLEEILRLASQGNLLSADEIASINAQIVALTKKKEAEKA